MIIVGYEERRRLRVLSPAKALAALKAWDDHTRAPQREQGIIIRHVVNEEDLREAAEAVAVMGRKWDRSSESGGDRAPRRRKKPSESAEGVGFEPTRVVSPAGFQDRCLQPLGHPSGRNLIAFSRGLCSRGGSGPISLLPFCYHDRLPG
jgi:hypothetical protein